MKPFARASRPVREGGMGVPKAVLERQEGDRDLGGKLTQLM